MARSRRFLIVFAPEVGSHVDAIPLNLHGVIRRAIREQLAFEPGRPTRNRKPLEELLGSSGATWELRCGVHNEFRVFYDIDASARRVRVLAIGVKDRNRLFIAGGEFVL